MAKKEFPAVSVIIPMYNAEKYIVECLESLFKQTLKNFEVIVADDGSTDNSVAVVENMFQKFSKSGGTFYTVKLNQNTGSPGIPRNVAMDFAKGKYILFLDSDDFLDETALEDFYNVAEEFDADVVHAEKCFKYKEIDGKFVDEIYLLESTAATEKPTLETFDIAKRITDYAGKKYSTFVWHKLFRREFLIENNIKFPNIATSEDFIFSVMCLSYAKNYVRIPFIGYHYRKHSDSVTGTPSTVEKYSCDLIEGVHFLYSFMQSQKFFVENPKYQYFVLDFFNQLFSDLIFRHIFFNMNLEPPEVYDFYCKNIFSLNPQKNIPLTAYLFVSTNIYKMLVQQQAEENLQLKKLLIEVKKLMEAGE